MRGLSAADLLTVWEEGAPQHPLARALTLLGPAVPDSTPAELAALPVGRRDALLIDLHRRTFGERLEGYAECAHCGERLELDVPAADLLALAPAEPAAPITFDAEGLTVTARLPDSRDLAAIVSAASPEDAAARLARRCVRPAGDEGAGEETADLSPDVLDRVDRWMSEADPLAEIVLSLRCAACGHLWDSALDVVDLLWARVSARASMLQREVHALATAYGWSEADILAMSPTRRQGYLDLVEAG